MMKSHLHSLFFANENYELIEDGNTWRFMVRLAARNVSDSQWMESVESLPNAKKDSRREQKV